MRSSCISSSYVLFALVVAITSPACSRIGQKELPASSQPEAGAQLQPRAASLTAAGPSDARAPRASTSPIGAPAVDGFDYPVDGGGGSASWSIDGDGYRGTLDFTEYNPRFAGGHCGEDWLVEPGSGDGFGTAPILAIANGVVRAAGDIGGNGIGNVVIIDHWIPGAASPAWEVIQSAYWHLEDVHVQVGEVVERGDPIGTMGNGTTAAHRDYTKYATHLHFEIRWDESVEPDHERGYGCTAEEPQEMTDPSEFIDSHRKWPK